MASSSATRLSHSLPLSLTLLLSTLLLFHLPAHHHRRSLLQSSLPPHPTCPDAFLLPPDDRCAFSLSHCRGDSASLLNYASLHFCLPRQDPLLSVPALTLLLLVHFHFLASAASRHFSPVVAALSSTLRLSPSMAAVTLLALGNGAPDVFASVAAVRGGHDRTGFGAILSAGAFVSAFVVGVVAVQAGPFAVDPAPFVRDVFFYLMAASGLFYVYLSAEIYLWQAVGFVGFYAFFVGFVFWMDFGGNIGGLKVELVAEKPSKFVSDVESGDAAIDEGCGKCGCLFFIGKIQNMLEVPVSILLNLTIPSTSPSEWSRFYSSANIAFCPLALLYSFGSIIPLDQRIVFFIPQARFPLWTITLFVSISLAVIHYILETEPPEMESVLSSLFAFIMSVFWISTMAGELLNCLAAIGIILNLPPALLGLTVLAWGNSVGDLVADVALAKAGQPAMAMAGCFAGPMFNMLVGLGAALVIETASTYPEAYVLRFHISIVVAFVFLLLSLMGSLLVVTWFRFRVTRFWGFCLVGLYLVFTLTSLAIAKFSG